MSSSSSSDDLHGRTPGPNSPVVTPIRAPRCQRAPTKQLLVDHNGIAALVPFVQGSNLTPKHVLLIYHFKSPSMETCMRMVMYMRTCRLSVVMIQHIPNQRDPSEHYIVAGTCPYPYVLSEDMKDNIMRIKPPLDPSTEDALLPDHVIAAVTDSLHNLFWSAAKKDRHRKRFDEIFNKHEKVSAHAWISVNLPF